MGNERGNASAARPLLIIADDDPDDRFFIHMALKDLALPIDSVFVEDGQELLEFLFGTHPAARTSAGLPDSPGQPPAAPRLSGRAGPGLPGVSPPTAHQPCLVLLDLNMPRLDGRAVLARLRALPQFYRLPVVVLTTSRALEDRVASLAAGADDFWSKPDRYDDLKLLLSQVCRRWLLPM
jgi:CheY-like chemotaxis protein